MRSALIRLLGEELVIELEKNLNEFSILGLDEREIMKRIKDYNMVTIMSMYLLSLENFDKNLAYKIKRASEYIRINREEKFKKSVAENTANEFLSKMDKVDIVDLAKKMNLYLLSSNEYGLLDKEDKKYCDILNKYINI